MPAPTQAKTLAALKPQVRRGEKSEGLRWTCAFWQRRTKNLKQQP